MVGIERRMNLSYNAILVGIEEWPDELLMYVYDAFVLIKLIFGERVANFPWELRRTQLNTCFSFQRMTP